MNAIKQLVEFGFNEKKAHLYSTLLRSRTGSATELAKKAGLKRTSVYDLLEDMVAEGLAVVSFSGSKRIYSATPPENLEMRLQHQQNLLDDLLPNLNVLYNHASHQPTVRYYDGVEGVQRLHDELLQTKSGHYYYFGSMHGLAGVVGRRYLKAFVRRRVKKKIWSHAIRIREQEINESFLLPGDENYRKVRYISLPKNKKVVNMTLFDNKVGITATAEEHYAMIIESHGLFTLMKVIWNYLWDSAED